MESQQPIITDAGKAALITAENDGLKLKLTHIGFGTSNFTPDGTETEALDEIKRVPIAGKVRLNQTSFQIMANVRADEGDPQWITSIYFYAENDVLFALYSTEAGNIFYLADNNTTTVNYVLDVSSLPPDQVTVVIDAEAAASLKLIGEQAEIIKAELMAELAVMIHGKFKEIDLANTSNIQSILRIDDELKTKANATEFGIVAAYQNLADSAFKQQTLQAGILSTRQYNYHGVVGAMRQVWDRNYNPGGSHNHPNYDRMSGNAETTMITPTGDFLQMRHSDYRHKQAIQHSDFLKTEDVSLPTVSSSVLSAGNLDNEIAAMRHLYQRYASGHFPSGFKFVLTYIETWIEPFTGNIEETFDSFRHQVQINNAVDQFRLNKVYADTGLKDRFENLPINKVFVAGLKDNGKPILGVLKGRFICKDLEEHGDLRPWIESVDDPVMDIYRDISDERFKIKEKHNRPGKLDQIMATVAGLDGDGAYLEEIHERYGITEHIFEYGTNNKQNAAYYHRFGRQRSDDASNRRDYKAGFNIPNFFKALNSRSEVLPSTFGDHQYRVSWAMPYELILYHPAMNWNPLDLTVNTQETNKSGRGSSVDNPFNGINPNSVWYKTPDAFFTGNSISDVADTGSGVKWVRGPNNIAHPMRASGVYIKLPPIEGVGTIRQRYPIYHRPQDGSYESSLASAYHIRSLKMTDKLNAEMTHILADQINNTGETV